MWYFNFFASTVTGHDHEPCRSIDKSFCVQSIISIYLVSTLWTNPLFYLGSAIVLQHTLIGRVVYPRIDQIDIIPPYRSGSGIPWSDGYAALPIVVQAFRLDATADVIGLFHPHTESWEDRASNDEMEHYIRTCFLLRPWRQTIEDGGNTLCMTFDRSELNAQSFRYLTYETESITLKKTGTGIMDWSIEITGVSGGYRRELIHACCVLNISAFQYEHTWVHFPYGCLTSAWAYNNQNKSSRLVEMMRRHTTNTLPVHNVLNSDNPIQVMRTSYRSDAADLSSAPFTGPTIENINVLTRVSMQNASWTTHPLQTQRDQHPLLSIMFEAYDLICGLVDRVWDDVRQDCGDLVEYISHETRGLLDFSEDPKALLCRILWSQSFVHALDHINIGVAHSTLFVQPVTRSVLSADPDHARREIHNANLRSHYLFDLSGISRPPLLTYSWADLEHVELYHETCIGLRRCMDQYNELLTEMGVLERRRYHLSDLSYSIDH